MDGSQRISMSEDVSLEGLEPNWMWFNEEDKNVATVVEKFLSSNASSQCLA